MSVGLLHEIVCYWMVNVDDWSLEYTCCEWPKGSTYIESESYLERNVPIFNAKMHEALRK